MNDRNSDIPADCHPDLFRQYQRILAQPMDRTRVAAMTFEQAEAADREYMRSLSPQERIGYIEYLRVLNYGVARTSQRLQRVLTLVEPERR